jgi:predicted dehydrogenase
MVTRVAMIGMSEGNGHPFSFSAILNGFSPDGLARSGWSVIYDYVRKQDPSAFGIDDLQVTHAWTQNPEVTKALCDACLIPNAVNEPGDLIDQVDAVIVARDDFEKHWALARPFLEAGLPVFVDKPLALSPDDERLFRPYLLRGKLMSCSGMRFARELDETRATLEEFGRMKLVRGVVVNEWEKYGVHALEAILATLPSRPVSVTSQPAGHTSIAVGMDDGTLVSIDALGAVPKVFRIDFFGAKRFASHEISDNFCMFRRMLWHFARMVKSGEPPIPPESTLEVMNVLRAGVLALQSGKRVSLDELPI